MPNLLVDERDQKFVLYEQLRVDELCEEPKFAEFSREMFDMVLEAAQKLAEKELAPTNSDGDAKGLILENGQVRVPDSFHEAYRHYSEGGWAALPIDQEMGGQGFPSSLYCSTMELFVAANMAFMMYPGSPSARLGSSSFTARKNSSAPTWTRCTRWSGAEPCALPSPKPAATWAPCEPRP
jgi:alkylation response protein AidB-like acyl-CoA dehydrogenase